MAEITNSKNEIARAAKEVENLGQPSSSGQQTSVLLQKLTAEGPSVPNSTTMPSRPKKRKKIPRDQTAPKQPLTGYLRFLRDRRDKVRADNPTMPFFEITKVLAIEWNMLPVERKQLYLDAAEVDKERYTREFNVYKQTEAYRIFCEKQKLNEAKKQRISGNYRTENDSENYPLDIPVFTKEFLDHNKACESKLRQLRKAITDFEAQNSILQQHIDNLHATVERLEADTRQQRIANQALQGRLDALLTHVLG